MHRFMSSLASSSSGRAEQPASASSSSLLRSAEQPATPPHWKILSIRDVQHWLADVSIASCSSADVQRIREAAAVLSPPKPRKEDVQPLQSKWQVRQQTKGKKPRPLGEVLKEFQDKVIHAAQKLQQQLSDSAERPAADEDPFLSNLKERQRKRAIETEAERERARSNGRLQNPKPHRDGTNELQGLPLAVLNNLLRREKTSASHRSCLQRAHVTLQSLAPQAQAVLYSLLECSSKAKECVDCCMSSRNLKKTVVWSMMQRLSSRP